MAEYMDPVTCHGSAMVRRGSAVVRRGSAMMRRGSAVVRRGSAMVRRGTAMAHHGSALALPWCSWRNMWIVQPTMMPWLCRGALQQSIWIMQCAVALTWLCHGAPWLIHGMPRWNIWIMRPAAARRSGEENACILLQHATAEPRRAEGLWPPSTYSGCLLVVARTNKPNKNVLLPLDA